ncbi:CobW family GTP-binding protein [Thiomicrorhabdus aquaedulcis]|uniref:CobW family GTP-binding protein n=1 Tax=Thiomicrorhabdus aquaedulcis TaxID=2211106 RepID=UPI000FD7190C|nr:GTP-binding protein [Thiomicrorhabdus aquaedulcis]
MALNLGDASMTLTLTKPTAVNLITGSLGAGKTTLLRHLIAHKPAHEHWVILVNEFGLVGIDGAILSEHPSDTLRVKQIPGGCICCSALGELKETLQNLVNEQKPDRILIEPTGLGEPDSLVDVLKSPALAHYFDVQTVFAVFDATQVTSDDFALYTILQNLANMADVIIFNKQDLTINQPQGSPQRLQFEKLHDYASQLYPPKAHIIYTQQAQIDANLIHLSSLNKTTHLMRNTWPVHSVLSEHMTRPGQSLDNALPYCPQTLNHLIERRYRQDINLITIGWLFDDKACFDWKKIHTLFESLNSFERLLNSPGLVQNQGLTPMPRLQRAKGVFKVGKPSMLFQWVNQHTTRELIAYRRDSRLELLINHSVSTTSNLEPLQTINTGTSSDLNANERPKISTISTPSEALKPSDVFDFAAFENALAQCLMPMSN